MKGRAIHGSSRRTALACAIVRSGSIDRPSAPAVVSTANSPVSMWTFVSGSFCDREMTAAWSCSSVFPLTSTPARVTFRATSPLCMYVSMPHAAKNTTSKPSGTPTAMIQTFFRFDTALGSRTTDHSSRQVT